MWCCSDPVSCNPYPASNNHLFLNWRINMVRFKILLHLLATVALWFAVAATTYGSDYSDAVLALNPDTYWRLNEAAGDGVDEIGNTHPLTLSGGPTQGEAGPRPADGLLGFDANNQAYDFTGAANGAATDDYVPVSGSNPRTIVAWLNMDTPPGDGTGGPAGTLGGSVGVLGYGTSVPPPNTRTGFKFQVARELEEGVYTGRDLFTLNIQRPRNPRRGYGIGYRPVVHARSDCARRRYYAR